MYIKRCISSERGFASGGVVLVVCLVCIMFLAMLADYSKTEQKLSQDLDIANAKVALLEQGFTSPRKVKSKNMFTVGFGPACKLTLDWDGKSSFSFSRFRAPGLKYLMPARDIPVMKNATYNRIRNLHEMRACGAEPQNN